MYCNRMHAWWSTQSWLATFLSLWYSVLCTVESLSLLYISLYLDLYVLRNDACISQVSSYKPNSYVSWSTSELRVRLALRNRFKPSSKTFLLTVPRRYFCCRSFVLIMSSVFHAFASVNCCLLLLFVMFIVIVLLSHLVSLDRCGTWLYLFLILAVVLTVLSGLNLLH